MCLANVDDGWTEGGPVDFTEAKSLRADMHGVVQCTSAGFTEPGELPHMNLGDDDDVVVEDGDSDSDWETVEEDSD